MKLLLTAFAAVSLLIPCAVEAQTPGKNDKDKASTYPFYGEVLSVNTRTLTLKAAEGKPDRKLLVSKETKIVNGDKEATLADVKPGKWVGGSCEKTAAGNERALSINVDVKQKK